MKIKTAVIGATGYTGSELVRLLARHPHIDLKLITSESRKGERFSDVHPQFIGIVDQELRSLDTLPEYELDVVFLALPHGVSMDVVKKLANNRAKIIDLSGDFRLSSPETYEHWYKKPHSYTEGFESAVYGLPELHRESIKNAKLVANPGCYPTSSILGLSPLIAAGLISETEIVIDAKSGASGAGNRAKIGSLYGNVNDNFKSYGLKTHRHTVEIEEQLGQLSGLGSLVQFTPHLLPLDRGILATIYSRPKVPVKDKNLQQVYQDFYADHPFVRVRNTPPSLKDVRATNFCDLYVTYDHRTNRILTISAIDNLMKGAAGQAVQNLNLMFGLDERIGLELIPIAP